jgi:hypothetical protein
VWDHRFAADGKSGMIALRFGARVADDVHRAVAATLDAGEGGYFQVVTEQTPDLRAATLQAQAEQPDVTAVVVIYPTEQISDKKKRILFSRISEGLEKERLIRRENLVVGVSEQPHRNWYHGGAR